MGIPSDACLLLPPQRSSVIMRPANIHIRVLYSQHRPSTVHSRTIHFTCQCLCCDYWFRSRPLPPDELSQAEQMHRPREMPCLRTRTGGIYPSDDYPHHRPTDLETFLSTPKTKTHLHSFVHPFFVPPGIALLFFCIYTLFFVAKTFRVERFLPLAFTLLLYVSLCTPPGYPPTIGTLCTHTK